MYSKLITTEHNPTSATSYKIPFCTPSDSGGMYRFNDGISYVTLEGTKSDEGVSRLVLGNSTSSGVTGNKSAELRLYGATGYYMRILPNGSQSANRALTLPSASGDLCVVSLSGTTLTIKT